MPKLQHIPDHIADSGSSLPHISLLPTPRVGVVPRNLHKLFRLQRGSVLRRAETLGDSNSDGSYGPFGFCCNNSIVLYLAGRDRACALVEDTLDIAGVTPVVSNELSRPHNCRFSR